MSAQDVAAAFLRHARESLGAVDAAIYLAEGATLHRAGAFGVPERWPEELPAGGPGHPLSAAASPSWIEGARELLARFPSQAGLPWRERGAWCFAPLAREGAACLGFDRPDGVAGQDKRLGALLAELCVDALERARLLALRDEFLHVASHELRTPLTSLSVQVALLKRSLRGTPIAQLGVIERQVARISSLIARLLDVNRMAEGSLYLDLSEMDLAEAVRDIAERLEPEVSRERCALEVHAPAPVIGRWDPLRVEQVVVNLCANAAKFAPGTTIDLSVRAEGNEAVLSVVDRGVGIAAEDLDRIFNKFERAAPSADYGGLGLGLYVVREVVRAFGGRVEVQSQLGQGSTFTVRLPGALPEAR
ncbi:MAG TPA: HAMP domain-containing sensor histidine kinase [Myxococcaceae bacterium]|jgi:signal transduction histidine kinase